MPRTARLALLVSLWVLWPSSKASLALAEPPPMAQVSLKKTRDLLAAKKTLTPVERDAQTLVEFGMTVFALDLISVPLGLTNARLTSAPDAIYGRVSWDMWATCNRLTAAQKSAVAALLPRLDRARPMAIAWAKLNTDQLAEGRDAMVARFDELTRGPISWPPLHEANQLLTCVAPHLSKSDLSERTARLDKLRATLPPIPPG